MQSKKPTDFGFSYPKRRRASARRALRRVFTGHGELFKRAAVASLLLAVFLSSFGVTLAKYSSEEARKGVMLASTAFFSSPQLARPRATIDDSGNETFETVVLVNKDWQMQYNGTGTESTQITVDVYNSELGNVSDVDIDYRLRLDFYNPVTGGLEGPVAGSRTEENPEDDFYVGDVTSISAEVGEGVYRLPANVTLTDEEFENAVRLALIADPAFIYTNWDRTTASLTPVQRELVQTYLRELGHYVTIDADGVNYSGSSNRHVITINRPPFPAEYLAARYPNGANINPAACVLQVTAITEAPYELRLMGAYVFTCYVGSSESMLTSALLDDVGRTAAEFIVRVPEDAALTRDFDITWPDNIGLTVDPYEDFVFVDGVTPPVPTHDAVAGTYTVRVKMNTAAAYSIMFYKSDFKVDHPSRTVTIAGVQ